jgi:hypothetical protein
MTPGLRIYKIMAADSKTIGAAALLASNPSSSHRLLLMMERPSGLAERCWSSCGLDLITAAAVGSSAAQL